MYWHGIDLYWAYSNLLPNIYKETRCHHRACDILHDALLRFALTSSAGRDEKPHAYLRMIARNLTLDEFKSSRRFLPLLTPEEMGSDGAGNPLVSLSPSPEELVQIKQRLEALQRVIDGLPARCKETFWLFRIEGLSQQEIANKLSITVNMVQRHLLRAMADLLEAQEFIR
ncbi:RNA polymerase sigma-70 factor, ECF subfamily [Methylophilus rhizosphaerae]|uniref:RNA polymerase sigma-70 factor, ECF subfamily n=1 Tax=Methylophilus rhizosphaerae TaxID=492660 RepID=A0A1G9D6I2_9PROT|nr:RNA polymerase sigma-70 factor, ECF subfamily [Methylophilus rhizosphaerae]